MHIEYVKNWGEFEYSSEYNDNFQSIKTWGI